jgi:DNA-binding NarL/FixJ family response regulator
LKAGLTAAIRAALDGKIYLSPSLTGAVLQVVNPQSDQAIDPVASLTPRQREILKLLAEGRSTKEIGSLPRRTQGGKCRLSRF